MRKTGERSLDVMRWGLVPFWAKDIKVGFANINAKAEGIDTKPGLPRGVSAPALPGAGRQFLRMEKDRDRQAALCDRAGRPADDGARGIMGDVALAGGRARSAASRSSPRMPNELCAELHNRMPVVLPPEAWPAWLGEEPAEPPQLKALLAPYPSDEMIAWPVSPRVGNVKNNDPGLVEPVSLL